MFNFFFEVLLFLASNDSVYLIKRVSELLEIYYELFLKH